MRSEIRFFALYAWTLFAVSDFSDMSREQRKIYF